MTVDQRAPSPTRYSVLLEAARVLGRLGESPDSSSKPREALCQRPQGRARPMGPGKGREKHSRISKGAGFTLKPNRDSLVDALDLPDHHGDFLWEAST